MSDNENWHDASWVLRHTFGHSEFRPVQREIVDTILAGEHSLTIMPTGGGKSLCYQLPSMMLVRQPSADSRPAVCLVLSPLIALMKDQIDALLNKGVDATFINSSLSADERRQRYADIADGQFAIVYVTPERFRKPDFLGTLARRDIRLLVVDEAHCISQWGHDFRPDYSRLREIRLILNNPVTAAFTATATPEVQADIIDQLGLQQSQVKRFHTGIERVNLDLHVTEVWGIDDKITAIKQTLSRNAGAGIVYFTLIKTLLEFSDLLSSAGVQHAYYHGDMPRNLRRITQEKFLNSEDALVLATPAFGMGIDKSNIRFVVHAEVPNSIEAYYQEIGRAGRDGHRAECNLLYDQNDLATHMEFLRWTNPDADFYHRLHDLLAYDTESVNAFGLEWIRERLHAKRKHDRRLETALGMMVRYDVIDGTVEPLSIDRVRDLPIELRDASALDAKKAADQKKLLSVVQYARFDGDRHNFFREYFLGDSAQA